MKNIINKDRIFVLGHCGMLGHVVSRFFQSKGFEVVTSNIRYAGLPKDPLLCAVRDSGCKWVVNGIGLIKQKSSDPAHLFLINSILPFHLMQELRADQRLIHASTDCVFSGLRGKYAKEEPRDSEDVYGLSKSLGEQVALDQRALVMRVSIVGPEINPGAGLLGWFLRQTGTINGYTNHMWNGITTLEWAKAAWEVITGRAKQERGLVQLGVQKHVSKHELLLLFNDFWPRDVVIVPTTPPDAVNRTLQVEWERPPLQLQLEELQVWMNKVAHDMQ